jgi:hypothetical protein
MKKYFRHCISFSLVLALLLSFSAQAFALDARLSNGSGITYTDNSSTVVLSAQEISVYDMYDINLQQLQSTSVSSAARTSYVNVLLSYCELQSDDSTQFLIYTTDVLQDALYNYNPDEALNIWLDADAGILYVSYTALDDIVVCLTFWEYGLSSKTLYFQDLDKCVVITDDQSLQYNNFREGVHMEITDDLLDDIDGYLSNNDISAIQAIDGLQTTIDEYGQVMIEPVYNSNNLWLTQPGDGNITYSAPFTNDSGMLTSLRADFPMYTKQTKSTVSKYINALSQNRTAIVKETRNNYIKNRLTGIRL